MAKCLYCGKKYTKEVSWQKFCSAKCRLAYYIMKENSKVISNAIAKYVKDKKTRDKILREIWGRK